MSSPGTKTSKGKSQDKDLTQKQQETKRSYAKRERINNKKKKQKKKLRKKGKIGRRVERSKKGSSRERMDEKQKNKQQIGLIENSGKTRRPDRKGEMTSAGGVFVRHEIKKTSLQ